MGSFSNLAPGAWENIFEFICLFFLIANSSLPCSLLPNKRRQMNTAMVHLSRRKYPFDKTILLWINYNLLHSWHPALNKLQSTPLLTKIMWIIVKQRLSLTFSEIISEWPEALQKFYPCQFWWEGELWERDELTLKFRGGRDGVWMSAWYLVVSWG